MLSKSASKKTAADILIVESIEGAVSSSQTIRLIDKITQLAAAGYNPFEISSSLLPLLTDGKVRMLMADRAERLELIDSKDIVTVAEAANLFQAHFMRKGVGLRG